MMPWIKVIIFSAVLYLLMLLYGIAYASTLGLAQFSEALAGTGGVLIGLSFALSGLSYFFNFVDRMLKYRRQLGVCGYFFALIYSLTLLVRFPDRYNLLNPTFLLEAEAVFGLVAMSIFTIMAVISENYALRLMGPVLWRRTLRSGYFALLLLIVRAYLVEGEIWSNWLNQLNTLPPPRLLLTIFAIGVLFLRFCLELSLRINGKNTPKPPAPLSPNTTGIVLPSAATTPPSSS